MDEGRSTFVIGVKVVMVWCSLALVVLCLTALFLGMRGLMEIGGSCASGGPYEVANACPRGAWILPVSIWVGLAAVALYVFAGRGLPGPKLVGLAWPALFLSLGWNFFEYGLNAPGDQGTDITFVLCGVLFVVMGVVPLFVLASPAACHWMLWSDVVPASGRQTYRDVKSAARGVDWAKFGIIDIEGATRPMESQPATTRKRSRANDANGDTDGDADGDVIDRLERLTALYRRGDLTVDEFSAAKAQLLDGGGR